MKNKPNSPTGWAKWLFIRGIVIVTLGIIIVFLSTAWRAYKVANLDYLSTDLECSAATAEIGGPWGQVAISVEVANTDESRTRGLMFREHLPENAGMLFVYPEPTAPVFWMKNTPLPLDILFFDRRGDLRHVHFGARPFDETPIPGGTGIMFVLEVEAGTVQKLGLGPRSSMRHPAIDQAAARWAC